MKKFLKSLYVLPFVIASSSFAQETNSLVQDLGTEAEDAITAVLTVVGTILVAGIAIPVAKKGYSLVKGALSRA